MSRRFEHVAVACRNAGGSPAIVCYTVGVSQEEYDDGVHYSLAYEKAANDGYESPMLGFDNSEHTEIINTGIFLSELASL